MPKSTVASAISYPLQPLNYFNLMTIGLHRPHEGGPLQLYDK
jgi:hypothetical protein